MDKINDRDREFALEFSRFVNDGMCSAHRTGAELANDHRYLVNVHNSEHSHPVFPSKIVAFKS